VDCGNDSVTRTVAATTYPYCRAAVEVEKDAKCSPAVGEDYYRVLRASLAACPSQSAYLRAFHQVMGFLPGQDASEFIESQCDLADRPR
jgi:hypothetical protein